MKIILIAVLIGVSVVCKQNTKLKGKTNVYRLWLRFTASAKLPDISPEAVETTTLKPVETPILKPVETPALEAECDKGKFYFDGCNNCECIKGDYACTRKSCPPEPAQTTISSPEVTQSPLETSTLNPACDKGQTFFDDCNTCICMGGKYACTRKRCPLEPSQSTTLLPEATRSPILQNALPEVTLSPLETSTLNPACDKGQTYFDGCNHCFCAGDKYGCTLKDCDEQLASPPSTIAPSQAPSN